MSIYRKAVNNPVTTALVFIAMAIFGVFSLINISLDRFPKFDANVIMVMSSYPGASAEDIETNLTKVLENSLNGVSDLKDITSTSKENMSMIILKFIEGVDIDVATNDVRDKLDMVNSLLPDGASLPFIFKFSADDMPIMIMAATAKESLPALEKILDDKLATPLARVSGVGTVSIAGAPQREIQVYCDPNKLEAYGLTVSGISSIIAAENRNVPSGTIDIGSNAYALRVEKEFSSADEMLDVVVGHVNGKTIYLRDVARVVDGVEERYQEAVINGVQGAQIIIQKQADANAVNVIEGVKKEMENIKKNLLSAAKQKLETEIDSLKLEASNFQETRTALLKKHEEAENIEKEACRLKKISDALNGSLTGQDKISLESYVQTFYYDRILKKANVRLMAMTDGQYELRRNREKGSGNSQTGLDTIVIDHYSGQERDVKTLSGGETFLASLSLALGLSDEIESSSGGIEMNSIFIDEGFGTW